MTSPREQKDLGEWEWELQLRENNIVEQEKKIQKVQANLNGLVNRLQSILLHLYEESHQTREKSTDYEGQALFALSRKLEMFLVEAQVSIGKAVTVIQTAGIRTVVRGAPDDTWAGAAAQPFLTSSSVEEDNFVNAESKWKDEEVAVQEYVAAAKKKPRKRTVKFRKKKKTKAASAVKDANTSRLSSKAFVRALQLGGGTMHSRTGVTFNGKVSKPQTPPTSFVGRSERFNNYLPTAQQAGVSAAKGPKGKKKKSSTAPSLHKLARKQKPLKPNEVNYILSVLDDIGTRVASPVHLIDQPPQDFSDVSAKVDTGVRRDRKDSLEDSRRTLASALSRKSSGRITLRSSPRSSNSPNVSGRYIDGASDEEEGYMSAPVMPFQRWPPTITVGPSTVSEKGIVSRERSFHHDKFPIEETSGANRVYPPLAFGNRERSSKL